MRHLMTVLGRLFVAILNERYGGDGVFRAFYVSPSSVRTFFGIRVLKKDEVAQAKLRERSLAKTKRAAKKNNAASASGRLGRKEVADVLYDMRKQKSVEFFEKEFGHAALVRIANAFDKKVDDPIEAYLLARYTAFNFPSLRKFEAKSPSFKPGTTTRLPSRQVVFRTPSTVALPDMDAIEEAADAKASRKRRTSAAAEGSDAKCAKRTRCIK